MNQGKTELGKLPAFNPAQYGMTANNFRGPNANQNNMNQMNNPGFGYFNQPPQTYPNTIGNNNSFINMNNKNSFNRGPIHPSSQIGGFQNKNGFIPPASNLNPSMQFGQNFGANQNNLYGFSHSANNRNYSVPNLNALGTNAYGFQSSNKPNGGNPRGSNSNQFNYGDESKNNNRFGL